MDPGHGPHDLLSHRTVPEACGLHVTGMNTSEEDRTPRPLDVVDPGIQHSRGHRVRPDAPPDPLELFRPRAHIGL
eukprot:1069060-Alexandrium_andersonii.AAC.1